MTERRRRARGALGVAAAVFATSSAAVLVGPGVADAALTVVARYEMDELSTGTNRTMVDSGPFDLNGTIGDSISTKLFSAGTAGYRWAYTPPDTGPKDDGRLAVVQTNPNLNPASSDFAIEIRYRTTQSFGNIVQKGQSTTDGGYWKIEQPDGFPTCLFRRNSSDQAAVVSPVRTNDGNWHTVRCERRATYVRMLVDGVEVDRRNRSVGSITNSFPMTIGGKANCNQNTNPSFPVGCDYYTGDLDWVRVEKDVPSVPNVPPTMRIATPSCVGLTCTFDSTGSSDPDGQVVDRFWDFGDGSDVEHQDAVATHSFPTSGTYDVTLVGSDDDGASSSPTTVRVSVTGPANQPPVMRFTVSCDGRTCTFDSSASSDADGDAIVSRSWSFGDGATSTLTGAAVQHAYSADGAYTVRLVGTDARGAVDTIVTTISVDAGPDAGSRLVPLPPLRVFDTRPEEAAPGPKGVVRGGTSIEVDVTGVAGVPKTGVTAVAINITAIGLQAPSFVTARPSGTPESLTSSLNLVNPGEVRANMIVVPVGSTGTITISSLRDAHLLGDIAGYFTGALPSSDDGRIVTQVPQRLFDTRPESGIGPAGKVGAGGAITVPVLGRAGVPAAGVAAVVLNVTATDSEGPGFVTAWPSGGSRPVASSLNVNGAGESVANQVIVPVGPDGAIRVFTLSAAHLLADVAGYVTDNEAPVTSAGLFVPLPPARAFDTRPGEPAPGPKGLVGPAGTITVAMAGVAGVPASAGGVLLNVTLIGSEPGFATLWPSGSSRPGTSNVNVAAAGDVRPNGAIVRLGAGGNIDAFLLAPGHLLADVSGYLLA